MGYGQTNFDFHSRTTPYPLLSRGILLFLHFQSFVICFSFFFPEISTGFRDFNRLKGGDNGSRLGHQESKVCPCSLSPSRLFRAYLFVFRFGISELTSSFFVLGFQPASEILNRLKGGDNGSRLGHQESKVWPCSLSPLAYSELTSSFFVLCLRAFNRLWWGRQWQPPWSSGKQDKVRPCFLSLPLA